MNASPKKQKLCDALAQLELCLETPVVPGEMERWTATVKQAVAEVERPLARAVNKEHPQKLGDISKEDAGLLPHVAQLKEQDRESLERFKHIRAQLEQLLKKAESVEPDEARLEDRLEKFIDAGLNFVIHVRKQEAAVDTWWMEALDRDRGVVD